MAYNISVHDFLARFLEGGARPNLYMTRLQFPAGVEVGDNTEKSYLCKAASLPASTIGTTIAPFMGRQIGLAGDRTFAPWTITLLSDNNFVSRKSFNNWHQLINKTKENTGESAPLTYFADMAVDVLDRKGDAIFTVELKSCWPTEVGEISLGYDNNDALIEFPITFHVNDVNYDA